MSKVDVLKELFRISVSAVQPQKLIGQTVKLNGRHLSVKHKTYEILKPVHIVGFGKAVYGMATILEDTLGPLLQRGVVVIPEGSLEMNNTKNSKIEFLEGARNNLPDENAMRGALRIKELVQSLNADDTIIVLISGGGSALLPLPKEGITLSEKLAMVKKLGNSGASIFEMNCVRKELSQLKGGGLAAFCYPARVITLILSDVLGDSLDVIASGPTCPNKDGPEKAITILKNLCIYENLPVSIKETLYDNLKQKQQILDQNIFAKVDNYVIGNNQIATEAILQKPQKMELQSFILSTKIHGDVEDVSSIYLKIAESFENFLNKEKTNDELIIDLLKLKSNLVPLEETRLMNDVKNLDPERDICVILAGEPTVLVTGNGIGGRNQQLALLYSLKLSEIGNRNNIDIWFLSCGTDGIDGPTDAAGAIGFARLIQECTKEGLEPETFLRNNDCYSFYSRFGGGKFLVKVGHTGTNVMDVHLMLIGKK